MLTDIATMLIVATISYVMFSLADIRKRLNETELERNNLAHLLDMIELKMARCEHSLERHIEHHL
jgi:hypothetical protein